MAIAAVRWLPMQIYIFPPLSLSLSLLLSVSLIQGWGEEEVELSAACPNSPWIMQIGCNWSPNRNGLLFTFLRSGIDHSFLRSLQSYLTSFTIGGMRFSLSPFYPLLSSRVFSFSLSLLPFFFFFPFPFFFPSLHDNNPSKWVFKPR